MIRYDSAEKLNRRLLRETVKHRKQQGMSLHSYTQTKQSTYSSNLLGEHNLPIIKTNNKLIPVYLLYKQQKFVIKCQLGTPYRELVINLYKQIYKYEINSQKLPKQQIEIEMKKVVGFSTVCQNLKIDYLLSKMQGKVQNSLLLQSFGKSGKPSKSIKEKKKFKYQLNKIENRNWNTLDQSLKNTSYQSKQLNSSIHSNNTFGKKKKQISKFNYEIYTCLAIGGFSKVYLSRSYQDGNFYAIKFIKKKSEKSQLNRISVINQMEICSELTHPFLVKMKQGFQTANFYCMVFEYCPGGELFYLLKRVRMMNQDNARFYFIQILLGIKYLHQRNILYRDLKPQNILIDWQGNLKIVDFGLSKKLSTQKQKTFSYCGSAQYMAPQMILRSGHNLSIDYYSLGALLYQLVTGLPPFYSKNQQQLQQSIIMEQLSFPNHVNLSNQIKDFLCHLLTKDHKHRLGSYAGMKQIIFHPWVGKFSSEQYLKKNKKPVPYPPNLQQHNFDTNQLGDDQQQFTSQVFKDFYNKNLPSQLKYYVKTPTEKDHHCYGNIIQNIVQEQINIAQNEDLLKSSSIGHRFIDTKDQSLIKFTNHLQQSKQNQKQNGFNQLFRRSGDLKRIKTYGIKDVVLKESMQNSADKYTQSSDKQTKMYQKLLPYFSKTKLHKPQIFATQNRKTLPRANILKLKVLANCIKDNTRQIENA